MGSGLWLGLPRTLYGLAGVARADMVLARAHARTGAIYTPSVPTRALPLVGLDVDRRRDLSFVHFGGDDGFGGVLQVARQGGGNPQTGSFFLLPALFAAFLGRRAFIRPLQRAVHSRRRLLLATTASAVAASQTIDSWSIARKDNPLTVVAKKKTADDCAGTVESGG